MDEEDRERRWRVVVEHRHRTTLILDQADLFAAFERIEDDGALPWNVFLWLLDLGMEKGGLPDRSVLHGDPRIVESSVLMDS